MTIEAQTNFDPDPYDDDLQLLGNVQPIPIIDVGKKERVEAPQYCSLQTWPVPVQGIGLPVQVLTRRPKRYKARLFLAFSSNTELIPANPAAGTDYTYTNNTGAAQSLASLSFTLVTDATVANRFIQVQIKDASGNLVTQVSNTTAIVASSTINTYLAQGLTGFPTGAAGTSQGGLPSISIQPGWSIVIHIISKDAGDQLSAIVLSFSNSTVSVYLNSKPDPLTAPNGPFGFLMPGGQFFDWDSAEPCYAIAITSQATISVEDQSYG